MLSSRALSAHRNVHPMDAHGLRVWGTSPERKGESEPTLNGFSALGWVRTGETNSSPPSAYKQVTQIQIRAARKWHG